MFVGDESCSSSGLCRRGNHAERLQKWKKLVHDELAGGVDVVAVGARGREAE